MDFSKYMKLYNSLKTLTNLEKFSAQEATGQFLYEDDLEFEKHKTYAKIMFKISINDSASKVSLTYEKQKMFVTAIFSNLKCVCNFDILLVLLEENKKK